ncbi:uncharacterized protein yc1106_04574 [Curvularia clavata]|uniref:Zn(2)-C6 fungal-type domain-containing protein n=1 Tax=Curvularia clavata TaxID=95742 RepID=A0A9Q8Z8V8_CURCL|nr:uncharacterized protein yc1106_04574 [Curvularia clavata]
MESTKIPAPYGQACAHCVRAKSRCMLLDGGTCERCHRLNKECTPSSGVRRKSSRNTKASKRSQLEDKLDDLVSILRTRHVTPQQDAIPFQAVTFRSLDFTFQSDGIEAVRDQHLTEEELEKFRWLHLPHFPLVHLPPNLSARQLENEKPLLSLAIKTISNKAYSTQTVLSKRLREIIALKMMVDGEKSLDLLLSVLTCMTCISTTFKYDIMPWSPQLEQDCSQLATGAETEGDQLLVAMARISRIILQAADISLHLNENNGTHAALHIAPLLFSLDQLTKTFPREVSQHSSIVAFTSTARISIYELLILHTSPQPTPSSQMFDQRRAEYLMAFLHLCNQCTQQYLEFDFINITTPTSVVFTHSLRNLHKLLTLTETSWDPSIVRQTVNIVEILELCAVGAERVDANIVEELGEHSVFAIAAKSVRESAPPNSQAQNSDIHNGEDTTMQGFTESLDLPFEDFSDDFWSNPPFYL